MSQLKPIPIKNIKVTNNNDDYIEDLLDNIEDIVYRAKTGREDPLLAIRMIEEQLANYIINVINKYEGEQ